MSKKETLNTEMTTNRYHKSKVYMIRDNINGKFYIGSTCNSLSARLSKHKNDTKRRPNSGVYKYFNEIGVENLKIILIEEYQLENKSQLLREEDKVIQLYKNDDNCLNVNRAFTELNQYEYNKIYYEQNIEKLQNYAKHYNDQNKELIAKKKKNYLLLHADYFKNLSKLRYIEKRNSILENMKENVTCSCCIEILKFNLKKHQRTKKHETLIKQNNS